MTRSKNRWAVCIPVLKNKYYVDEFYQAAFIRPANWLANVFTYKLLDQTIIDGILHGIARFGVWLGNGLRNIIDLPVVNGAGDNAAARHPRGGHVPAQYVNPGVFSSTW